MGKVREGLFNGLLEGKQQPCKMGPRLSDFLGFLVYSISKERNLKKSKEMKVNENERRLSPCGRGSGRILFCNIEHVFPSDFGGRKVALTRTKTDKGRIA